MNTSVQSWFSGIAIVACLFSTASAELVRNPTAVGTSIDLGQLVKGDLYDGSSHLGRVRNQTLTRTGVYLTESGTYNDRLTVKLTIGGLFWFAIPETKDFQDRRVQFGPGVGQAQGLYAFGSNPKEPSATLQFGLFPHKYSESVNLGEYLYRSGTYPGTLVSGGWSYLNAAAYLSQGARLTIPTFSNKLSHDITLYMERDLEPAHDLSPGYMVTFKTGEFLEIGAGLIWSHAISLNSDRLAPKTDDNAYNTVTKLPVKNEPGTPTPDSLKAYYTFKGFKTAAHINLDFGALLGGETFSPGDFGIYSEVALLGVENQPYYYEKKSERMPIMIGLNVPTGKILDRLAVEAEHVSSPFPNSNIAVLQGGIPVPVDDPYKYKINEAKFNDWKWSVYASRKILEGVTVHAQAASDHLRHFNRSATPGAQSATSKSNQWYYILRLDFGI
jgi:hypothetical protein